MLKGALPLAIAVGTLLGAAAPSYGAVADDPEPNASAGPPTDCGDDYVCIGAGVDMPGRPSSGDSGDNKQAAAKGSGKKPKCSVYATGGYGSGPDRDQKGRQYNLPCQDPKLGSFSNGCYYKPAKPQPPASDPVWKGHKPGKGGAIYQRTCPVGTANNANNMQAEGLVWLPQAPGQAAVDPAQIAQQAIDKMKLTGPDIGITPKPSGKGVVGMPVYMWTEKGTQTYGPTTATASAGGLTVTATAKVSKIVWKMGDGKSVTCTTAGTPYKASYGKKPSPDCGHRYDQPSSTTGSGKFHVTATSTWTIDWQATGGESGQITEVRESDVDITVAEVQVLN